MPYVLGRATIGDVRTAVNEALAAATEGSAS